MPRRERSLAGVVRAAEDVLRGNRVDHVFVGAISVIVFGEPRTTRDVDVLARISPHKVGPVVRGFRRRGFFASEEDLEAAARERSYCSIEDRRSQLRIDLVPAAGDAVDRALRGSVRVRWRGIEFPVAGPEHTIVMKLKFGSPQDIEDAFGILTEQWDALDFARVRAFARRERVLADLEALIRRVEKGRESSAMSPKA